jgi:4-amino-4-deoxychorismate lyase
VYGKKPDFKLALVIRIPIKMQSGHFRCRVDYDVDIKEIAFSPYIRKEIKSLKLVTDDSIEYPHKYSDRGRIEKLFESRDECDDILIVKNGLITDTSMANIIFRDFGIITEARIKVSDLNKYNEAKIINALRDPNEFEAIPILNIKH